jgi:hypothetical protein
MRLSGSAFSIETYWVKAPVQRFGLGREDVAHDQEGWATLPDRLNNTRRSLHGKGVSELRGSSEEANLSDLDNRSGNLCSQQMSFRPEPLQRIIVTWIGFQQPSWCGQPTPEKYQSGWPRLSCPGTVWVSLVDIHFCSQTFVFC